MSLTVRDLIDLAVGDNEGANAQVTQIYQWRHERMTTLARSSVGTGTALLVGLAITIVTDDSSINQIAATAGAVGAIVVVSVGFLISWRTRRLDKQYVAAQFLLAELQTVRPFLRRYLFREGVR